MKNLARYQILATLPLLVILAVGAFFHELVKFAIETNAALNGIILGVMLVGVVIMHQLIWSIRRQEKKADQFIRRVKQGEPMRDVLQDKDLGTSDIGIVCDHLVHTGESSGARPVEVVEAGMRSLHVTLDSRQELAQFLVGFLVALGLLGTFIGILETLLAIGDMLGGFASSDMQDLDKSFMGLISDLTKPLKGMGTAFSASMFGLLGSLCLGLTMVPVRRCTEEFLTGMRHGINQLIKDRRSSQSGASLPQGVVPRRAEDFEQMRGDGEELLRKNIEAQAKVVQKLEILEQRFGELGAALNRQAEGAAETNALLRANSIPRESAEQFMGQVKVLATTATENSTNLAALLPALSGVTQNLGGFSDTLLQQRDHIQKTMLSAAESQGTIRSALVSLVDKENDIRAAMYNEMTQLRKFMLEMQPVSQVVPLLSEIGSRINEQSTAANGQQESLRQMTQAIAQTFGGIKSGMTEMLLDAEKHRTQQSEMSAKLLDAQRAVAEIGKVQQSMDKVAEVLTGSIAANQALLQEIRDMRKSFAVEVRAEVQQALRQQAAGSFPSGQEKL